MTDPLPGNPDLTGSEAFWLGGRLAVIHTDGGETDPAITEHWLHPGQGPEEHLHRYMDWTFFLLEGSMTFRIAGAFTELAPGRSVVVPRDVGYTYLVNGSSPARLLMVTTPGHFWADYLRAIGKPATAPTLPPADFEPVPMEYVRRAAVANGLTFVGDRIPGASRTGR